MVYGRGVFAAWLSRLWHTGQVGKKRLKRDQVLDVRAQAAAGHQIKDIAAAYGVHVSTISRIVNGHSRLEVKDIPHPKLPRNEEEKQKERDMITGRAARLFPKRYGRRNNL